MLCTLYRKENHTNLAVMSNLKALYPIILLSVGKVVAKIGGLQTQHGVVRWKAIDVERCNTSLPETSFKETGNSTWCLHYAHLFLGLFFGPEGRGKMFLQKVCYLSTGYNTLYRRRWGRQLKPQVLRRMVVSDVFLRVKNKSHLRKGFSG
jgi:hypothetical protein